MATHLTPTTEAYQSYVYGNFDLYSGVNTADSGVGLLTVHSAGILNYGLSDLNQTTINTDDGELNIYGTNRIVADITNSIELTATDSSFFTTTAGSLTLSATATDATGIVSILASGTGSDAILISASNATSGQVHITSGGAAANSILIDATNAAGQVSISSAGTGADAIKLSSSAGGIAVTAVDIVTIDTTNTTNGIQIGTLTNTVPITIGTTGSLTTVRGDFLVEGTTTSVNTVTITVDDTLLILNSGNAVAGVDAGIAVRRYQTPNDTLIGSVIATADPIQESGAFQAGSATPGTLVLSPFASATDNWYRGWWIKVTSGTGIDQVRRIKSYVGSTKTATIYTTSDNVTPPPGPTTEVKFSDGLDLTTAPAATDTYSFYNSGYITSFYDETSGFWSFKTVADAEDGITGFSVQQPQDLLSGEIDIAGKTYYNVHGTASTTTITFTLIGHGLLNTSYVKISDSSAFTPAITTGMYKVQTTPTADTFTITAGSSTTATSASSATIYFYNSSKLKVNTIESFDPEFPIAIPGLSIVQDIIIPKTSTSEFVVTLSALYGSYLMLVSDISGTGAAATFACSNAGTGVRPTRIVNSKGAEGQRISATWNSASKIAIFHDPAGSGAGNYTYRIRLLSCL